MNKQCFNLPAGLVAISLSFSPMAEEEGVKHDHHDHDVTLSVELENRDKSNHEERSLHLSSEQQKMAGILTERLTSKPLPKIIHAPGEILLDAYATSKVSPRITAQIIYRHAKLGDIVSKGTPLITLSSVEMAKAQGELLIAALEWKRIKRLGRKVVSDKRYIQVKVTFQQANARARAYGMTNRQIKKFLSEGNSDAADGTFQLLASQLGTVIKDNFILGEQIEAGYVLFEITDESKRWVEARLVHDQADQIKPGADAIIHLQNHKIKGKVIQIRHTLDEVTRRHGVRIAIPNPEDHLHPGLFVSVTIEGKQQANQLSIENDAALRTTDGDWIVFVEHKPNHFEPIKVDLLYSSGEKLIIKGIPAGTVVVIQGAFFLQSELAKSGFEIHNH